MEMVPEQESPTPRFTVRLWDGKSRKRTAGCLRGCDRLAAMTDDNVLMGALIGVAVALLLVGVVSGTIIRHVIQVAPVVLAALIVFAGRPWSRFAAIAVFLFWLLIMLLIWLFLLG